jgi:hypothetical protein
MRPGFKGHGLLRVGNPGNKSNKNGNRSAIAREILEASTPEAAQVLEQMSLKGTVGRGKKLRYLSDPDRIKAVVAHLDRGGAPAVIAGAAGAGLTVLLHTAATDGDAVGYRMDGREAVPIELPPAPPSDALTLPTTRAGVIPGRR